MEEKKTSKKIIDIIFIVSIILIGDFVWRATILSYLNSAVILEIFDMYSGAINTKFIWTLNITLLALGYFWFYIFAYAIPNAHKRRKQWQKLLKKL